MLKWIDILQFASKGNPVPHRRVEKTEEKWKEILTPEEFHITRKKGTERPFTGEHCEAIEPGKYSCKCCDTPLFDSTEKFDSRSGWPSFTQPVDPSSIKYKKDQSFGMIRVEVMCNVCDAHLGHVFNDGPPPSELRYCINSVSLAKQKI
ncbi:MAG: peptide-methionine (R)-S-oxide reductase MsrB [Cyclobacteriaceae bacterium]|nr:peptide-methionine (R)-S-oxide reductase MsrB [Cyclobacteriaceae bacterium]